MELNKSKGASPLYYQLKELLEEKIRSGEYPVGSKIPSELELEKQYSLSRVTVRQALNELANEGLVLRRRGLGTIVQAGKLLNEQLTSIKSFTLEMQERGVVPGTRSIVHSTEIASKEVAQHLIISPGEIVHKVERVRTGNDLPVVVFNSYFAGKYGDILINMRKEASLYEHLKDNGVLIKRASDNYIAVLADIEIARMLEIPVGSPVLRRTRVSYDTNGDVVEYSKCFYNSSLYSCSVELMAIMGAAKE